MTLSQRVRLLPLAGVLSFAVAAPGADLVPLAAGFTSGGVYYPTNSLGYALETNYTALTNSRVNYNGTYVAWNDQPWTGYIWGSTNVATWRWNSNSIMYGKRG